MGQRNITFVNNGYYHIFNRGVDKRVIFKNQEQLDYFFKILQISNSAERKDFKHGKDEKIVDIVAYCLLPNHFHLLLKQKIDNGISIFMQKLGTSYTKFFNVQDDRTGSLFQGKFKANQVVGEFALPIVSTYVNLNYKHHQISIEENFVKSSIFEYLNETAEICNKEEMDNIIQEIGGIYKYKKMIKDFSIAFAQNKGVLLDEKDFEF